MTAEIRDRWYAIDLAVPFESTDAAEAALDLLDPLGTETDTLKKKPGDTVRVTAFFDEPPPKAEIERVVRETFSLYETPDTKPELSIREVAREDWLAEWKRHWKPTPSGRFLIAPPWAEAEAGDRILIRIEPNMAFGTGTHDTTRLCLEAVGELYSPEMSFLDVGTGTGILAIAAAKLARHGARIEACDTDVDSVRIARENAEANGVADRIEFREGTLDRADEKFDIVCANLTLDVITPLIDTLLASSRGRLILSGILAEQEDEILKTLAARGYTSAEVTRSGEWIAVVVVIA